MIFPTFAKFVPLVKVEEVTDAAGKTRTMAYGLATEQKPDCDNEICVYADIKPQYEIWKNASLASTTAAGQEPSLGNIRLQHNSGEIAGKAVGIEFNDEAKQVFIKSEAVNSAIGDMLKGGFVTGYSQAGSYLYRKCSLCRTDIPEAGNRCPDCKKNVAVLYAAEIVEVSYVDKPCLPTAVFTLVKANRSTEVRKFAQKGAPTNVSKTKRVSGEDLPASAFLIVGDPEDTSTWKLPVKFSAEKKTKSHIRNAIARFDQLKDVAETEKSKAWTKLTALAEQHGINVTADKAEAPTRATTLAMYKTAMGEVHKGMYQVATFARLLDDISYLQASAEYERAYEDDDSTVPDELLDSMRNMATVFLAMAAEEVDELTAAAAAKAAKGAKTMDPEKFEAMMKGAKKTLSSHFKKAAAHAMKCAKGEQAMADLNTKKSEHHAEMAAKEDVGDDAKAMHKADVGFHKSMAAHHMGLCKAHEAHAEHLGTMVDTQDDNGEKSAAAVGKLEKSLTAADPDPTLVPAIVPAGGNEAGMFQKALNEGFAEFQKSDEFKGMLKSKMQAMAAEALGVEMIPTVVKTAGAKISMIDRAGNNPLDGAPIQTSDDTGL